MIFNICGGGGAALNFKIVGGTTAPSNPAENTFWVNTSKAITDWALSANTPNSPVEGMVWIKVGSSSIVAFNALKKNNITVYPCMASQYIGGAWTGVPTKCYQNGAWKDFCGNLIENGSTAYTLKAVGKPPQTGGYVGMETINVTQNSGSITITGSNGYGIVYIEEAIDLTPYKTLTIKGQFSRTSTDIPTFRLNVWSSIGSYISSNLVAHADLKASGETSLDVSNLTGNHIIGIDMAGARTHTITDLWLT